MFNLQRQKFVYQCTSLALLLHKKSHKALWNVRQLKSKAMLYILHLWKYFMPVKLFCCSNSLYWSLKALE